ncbi:MAG: phospholipid carrier-dependent glycosyltransferase [Candidatus Didemnitutus sp.]|nr:phospholipid carrier-dependent glycosyltransferase [Candidatus Didemnitutus sp.]
MSVKELILQMLGVLPLLVLAAGWRHYLARGQAGPDALVNAVVALGAGIWLLANALSFFGALQPGPLRLLWGGAGVLALVALWRGRDAALRWPRPSGRWPWLLAVAIAILLGITLVRAVVAPPNTVDVMNYHLPRQVMWLQQGGLDPYETVNDRENMMPPLAEIIGLQFLALTGDDRWANLVQWSAYAGLALLLGLIVRRLGGSRTAAGAAALLGLLLPMAYHESTSAKNDLQATVWLLVLAVRLLAWRERKFALTANDALGIGVVAALACLTKSTALFYAPLLGLCALWPTTGGWRELGQRHCARAILLALLTWAVLVAPFHLRNQAWYGHPLGQHRAEDGGAQANETISAPLLLSNLARHATVHALGPWDEWNRQWLRGVHALHRMLGVDVNDPRTTLWILQFRPHYAPAAEMVAGAPAHFYLGLPLLLALAGGVGWGGAARRARWLAVFVLTGALVFCAVVKWQPWAARLQLPLFALGIVAAVVAVEAWRPRIRGAVGWFALIGAAAAWWPGADTDIRPLWTAPTLGSQSRADNFYRTQPLLAERTDRIVHRVQTSGVRDVLVHNLHDITYPVLRALRHAVPDIHFHGAPAGRSPTRPPEALLLFAAGAPHALTLDFAGRADWRIVSAGVDVVCYLPLARVRELGWANEVPPFVGWIRQVGLPWSIPLPSGVAENLACEFPDEKALLAYVATGRPLALRGRLERADSSLYDAVAIVVTIAGVEQGKIILAPTERAIDFDLVVPGTMGPHVLELVGGRATAGRVRFTRLQIVD